MTNNLDQVTKRLLNPTEPAIIVAEIGSNFDGSLETAEMMIKVAAESGCDFAKFQVFTADSLVQLDSYAHTVLSPLELNREWIPQLVMICKNAGIEFCASPFDSEAVDLLIHANGAPFFKIASPEVHDTPLIEYIASQGKPIIISTGLMTEIDIRTALDVIKTSGNPPVCVMHCVSDYPTIPKNINLGMMNWIKQTFDVPVGFSDHSLESTIPLAAISLGARVIEKHITLDRKRNGPDHHFALEPDDLKSMVQGIREIEAALGKNRNYPTKYPIDKLLINNKSLVAAINIQNGAKITREMLSIKRAKSGIRPKEIDKVIGRITNQKIKFDETIEWTKIG
jgi:N,N'-diacetyllegionaminate synthase